MGTVLAALGSLAIFPTELGLPAKACTGRDRQRSGLDVADDHAALLQFDERRLLDVALYLAGDRDAVGAHAAGQLRADLERQVALNVHGPLEPAGDPYAATAFDLALDRDVRGDQRLLARRGCG